MGGGSECGSGNGTGRYLNGRDCAGSLLPYFTLQPMKMEPIEGSETSAIINQTPGNYPKENLLYSVHGESLKSRKNAMFVTDFNS